MKSIFYLFSILIFFNIIILNSSKTIEEVVTTINASCYYVKTTGKYKVEIGKLDKMAAAYAIYTNSYTTKGWDFLTLSSYDGVDDKYSDEIKNYAMGYLEGVLTYERIYPSFN